MKWRSPDVVDPEADSAPTYVVIGASGAKGLRELKALVGAWPRPLNAIVLVVLHRPPEKPSALAEVLAQAGRMPVRIACQGEVLSPGFIYIGEPDQHLTVFDRHAKLVPHESLHRNRTIDLLFASVAAHAGSRAIGVVLSGSLDDGSRGLEAIHKRGGVTMVVTPEGSGPPGMPQNAIDFDGPINVIGSAGLIAAAIVHLVANPHERRKFAPAF
jgi:two-component system, chemotaxis family, protein-glutamate methylesterase/glutaminase